MFVIYAYREDPPNYISFAKFGWVPLLKTNARTPPECQLWAEASGGYKKEKTGPSLQAACSLAGDIRHILMEQLRTHIRISISRPWTAGVERRELFACG